MKRFFAGSAFVTLIVFVTVLILSGNADAKHRKKNRTKPRTQNSKSTGNTGFYVGVNAGLNLLSDSALQNNTPLGIDYDLGYRFGGFVGYDFGLLRLDAEIAYKANDPSNLITPTGPVPTTGSTTALTYMVNGYIDIPTKMSLEPYLGVGIGFANISLESNIAGPFPVIADDSDTVFAYQLSAGVGYAVTRSTTVTLGYRYFATDDPDMINGGGTPFTTEYQTHEFNLGVRFRF